MEVGAAFVAGAEPFEPMRPGKRALDHPADLAQSGAVGDAPSGDPAPGCHAGTPTVSAGRSCQAAPVRSTNRTPASAVRSGTRNGPGCRWRRSGEGGSNGATRSHRSSGTRSARTRTLCRPRSLSTRPAASHRDLHAESGVTRDRALSLRRPPAEGGLGSTPTPTTPPSRTADGSGALPRPAASAEEPRYQSGKASHQACRADSSHAPQRGPAGTAGPAPDRFPPGEAR